MTLPLEQRKTKLHEHLHTADSHLHFGLYVRMASLPAALRDIKPVLYQVDAVVDRGAVYRRHSSFWTSLWDGLYG